jgi:hypothetical protein
MAKRLLILGLRPDLVQQFEDQLGELAWDIVSGSTLDDLRSHLTTSEIDHIILGGGLDIATRASAVQLVFELSDRATIHMKDQMSGPEGFVPFVKAIVHGLSTYEPRLSAQANLRARRD